MALALNAVQLALVLMAFTAGVITVKVLLDASSVSHRRRYTGLIRVLLLTGTGLGVGFTFAEEVALVSAALTSFCLLGLALYYQVVGGKLLGHRVIQSLWTPREQLRDAATYFSLFTGTIGIVSTVLSSFLPYVLPGLPVVSVFVPLTFDGIAVLATVLEFTIVVPPYNVMYGLVYSYYSGLYGRLGNAELYVEDIDFSNIVAPTTHTEFELRDTLEALVREGFAIKQSPTPLGRVRFRIKPHGIKFLQVCWTEIYIKIASERDRIEKILLYVEQRLRESDRVSTPVIRKARIELNGIRRRVRELREDYGSALGGNWYEAVMQKIHALEARLTPPVPEEPVPTQAALPVSD